MFGYETEGVVDDEKETEQEEQFESDAKTLKEDKEVKAAGGEEGDALEENVPVAITKEGEGEDESGEESGDDKEAAGSDEGLTEGVRAQLGHTN
jgi:hypothetical protein